MAATRAHIGALISAIVFVGSAQSGSGARLEDVERTVGPLEVSGQRFTVVLHKKRVPGSADPDFGETLSRLEVKDGAGRVHHQQIFPYEVVGDRFAESLDATVQLLRGQQGSGLLITCGDVSHFRVQTGDFFAIVPLRIIWLQNPIGPGWRYVKATPTGPRPVCAYQVEADRAPSEEGMTFVRLHVEAQEGFGIPAHVVVKRDSKAEFLEAEVELRWQEDANGIGMSIGDDPWLKVRIEGREGWFHTQEDFFAIGLPQAG
jgi:hypothetical protein